PDPRDLACRVGDRAEGDRLGRTGLLAGGAHLTGGEGPILEPGVDLSVPDPLDTEGALLHHAPRAYRHRGVLHHPLRLRDFGVVVEPVEPAHLVRAVVGAEAGPDTAIVGHLVEPV